MIKYLTLFLCCLSLNASEYLCPLCEEDQKFIHYRSFVIISSIQRIENILNNINPFDCFCINEIEAIRLEISKMKFSLRYIPQEELKL